MTDVKAFDGADKDPDEAVGPDPGDVTDEHLEEVEKRADETIAKAREVVDRAKETLHDQILPMNEHGYGEDEVEDEEGGPDREDTRGAWPNWT